MLMRTNGRWATLTNLYVFRAIVVELASAAEVTQMEGQLAEENAPHGARSDVWFELVGRGGEHRRYDVGWAPEGLGQITFGSPGPIPPRFNRISLLSDLLVTADTRAIELHVQDQLVARFERPKVTPRVEAILLSGGSARVAMRVTGGSLPIEALLEQRQGDELLAMTIATVALADAKGSPCWSVIELDSEPPKPGVVLELTLQDGFHFFELSSR